MRRVRQSPKRDEGGSRLIRRHRAESPLSESDLIQTFDTLADVFLLDVRALDGARLGALWSKLAAGHEAWVAAGRP